MDFCDYKANIVFNFREKLYHTMLTTCKLALQKFTGEISLNLYHALALSLNNRHNESIRELEVISDENDIQLATTVALIYLHRLANTSDKDTFSNLEKKLRELRKTANAVDLTNTAFVLFTFHKYSKALDYAERALKLGSDLQETLLIKGWILIALSAKPKEIMTIFEKCTNESKRNLEGALGLCEAYLLEKNCNEAINVANKTIVRFPSSKVPLVYKLKALFALQDFDSSQEIIKRILLLDNNNYNALKMNILILLCKEANYEEAAACINSFYKTIIELEPNNPELLSENGKLFSRICARSAMVLTETYNLMEKAVQINNSIEYLIELGQHCLIQGKIKEASKYYKMASKTDNTSFNALLGMTLCELTENGRSDQLKQQIFFLLELQEGSPDPLLLYMRALLSDDPESIIQFLEEACAEQLKPLIVMPHSDEYLLKLDPDFLLNVLKTYLQYLPNKNITNKSSIRPTNIILNSLNTLKIITKACPGLEQAQFLLGRVQYLNGDQNDAMKTLTHVITELEPSSSNAHLLIAQINLNTGHYDRAAQSLEIGLSYNFKVRESPLYHLIQGFIEKSRNNLDEAIRSFTTALTLINPKPNDPKNDQLELTLADKATIYIELINAHREANQLHEATKLMEQAMDEFQNTPEESQMIILNAQHAALTNNVQKAIDMLNKVNPNESYFVKAKMHLADILLTHRRDKRAFMACYKEMVQFNPSPESHLLLGDAYLRILEPDKALEAYNNALQINPTDPYLMSKMGKALVNTHYFKRAVAYYKDSIAATDDPDLKLQLATLYMKLKEHDKSENLIQSEIERERVKKSDDLISLQYRTKLFKLLSEIMEKSGKIAQASEVLKLARDNQSRIRKIMSIEQTVVPEEEINCLVQLNMKLAELAINLHDNEKAIAFYKDAINVSPDDSKILAALAKLYMQMNYLELCQQTSSALLNQDPDNETASVLMADIAFRKVDFDMSVFHFTQLVNKQPTNWNALVRLVEVLRRTGSIDEIPQYLQQAEQFSDCPEKDAGFCYCTALYQWYTGNLNAALKNFNIARQDPDFGQDAIVNMIEICLNPEEDMLGEQFIDVDDYEYRDSRSLALKTAERLLKELKQKSDTISENSLKYRILDNFLLLASKEKYKIEQALQDFTTIASQDAYKDCIGPILGMATAYTLLKQTQRAKTQLKRVVKSIWTFEDAYYLERCWLLLADYYVQSGKNELSVDLLKKVLQYNMACSKAYELSGFISEKDQRYKDAANYYEKAWKFGGKNNPVTGYKLAYNLMKTKKYAQAVEVGHQVLKNHPEYIRIKKDIIDKSITNLRT